jgi:RNA polymerase sigma factor (sigma-70 family)
MVTDPDYLLIDKVLSGETAVYSDLIDRYKRYVFAISWKILLVRAEAEEATQDTFIKAFQALKGFNRDSKFSTWLYRIAFNTSISYKRRQRKQFVSIENTVIGYDQDAENNLEKSDKKKFLYQALEKLNEADRTALTLFYLDELSLEEIAEVTGMQANTAKVRIHRARLKIADELKNILNKEALTL